MADAVIVSAVRSPIGRANKGSLVDVRPDDLSAQMINAALAKVPELDGNTVEDVIWGCGQPAGESGYNVARVASVLAGLKDVPGVTVNRYCSSSLQSIRMAAHAIQAGEGDAFVAGGVETVSRFVNGMADGYPNSDNTLFTEARQRTESILSGEGGEWVPSQGLPDVYIAMGMTAENVASHKGVSRERQDEFAARSQQLAEAAIGRGFYEREITPVEVPVRDEEGNLTGETRTVNTDDGPRAGTTAEKLAGLNPVFKADGSVTAGNACPLNDGAAATIVMSSTRAAELGIKPLARIIASGVSGLDPEIMGLGPIGACKQALARAGMSISDIDMVEINEAFAAQVLPSADEIGIDIDSQLNLNGGAIALGHPFGMTGARIMTTLLNGLEDADKTIGMESMCVGGGQGMAMIVERLA